MYTIYVTSETMPWVTQLKLDPYVLIDFDSHAEFRVLLFNQQNQQTGVEHILMDGYEYEQWSGKDVPYVKEFILARLDMTEQVADGYGE